MHIHDVFLPGEWVLDGWGWNELYLVQSFLIHNSAFEVELGVRWLLENAPDALLAAFPGLHEHRERAEASLRLRRR